ncbi:polar amino acid ABC transporter, inner membrane subunit [Pseudarthrobacter chlorophenolicus A6]|uniref:Polar amino acid ABC transporter, inner membrane subunit n=1 Tax=Pseudarthrobacter chlorophenolicus (strain ATCC 700700 / DSM 12829 / CIP 107037 / JCM 12360 / KCTC 9906 / NCIMB 13794 / A6) TaxID=452863 RepID=B8HC73_PSECP|nr:amino acid ABC transporter permease [Pseudarthrobacter chlorophenolicus]ACL40489.1 polar amino acid ABC transporter, inner membrane subunit [Pseudarthrobacter chlorophenolicus A6]SDQ80594.1 amino acid ABC transporter membrane protein 2, PAAT family [Pseudarthrobacter chlorophenolicus]
MSSVLYDVPGPKARRISLIASIAGAVLILGLVAWIVMILAQQGIFEGRRWQIFTRADVWRLLGNGLGATLSAAALAAVIAFPLGLALCLLRIADSPIIRIPVRVVLEFLRGMPVVLMMLFVLLGFGTSPFIAVVTGLVLYNAAVFAEIIRAGISSLPKGQREAGLAIGLTSYRSRMLIELPQAIRRMMPSLVAQMVVLLKDTSLGYIVAYGELLRAVQVMADFLGNAFLFPVFFVAAAIYIAINILVSRLAVWIERRGSKKAAGGTAKAEPAAVEAGAP